MGEYEDRYPDAYGREEAPASPPQPEDRQATLPGPPADEVRRGVVGAGAAREAAASSSWQHAPASTIQTFEPSPPPPEPNFRGLGPRGYVRSPTRIYEDICDRLTEHALIDASDIEVLVGGIEVMLIGSVGSPIAAARAEAIAREVPGVKTVRNALTVRGGGGER